MAAPAKPSAVFVRNLAFDTTDASLEGHFESVGPVKEAWVVRDRKTKESRGFGFVGFVLSDDAERAVTDLNGSAFGGRKITVDLAKKKGDAGDKGPAPERVAQRVRDGEERKRPASGAPSAGAPAASTSGAPPAKRAHTAAFVSRQKHRVILRNLAFR